MLINFNQILGTLQRRAYASAATAAKRVKVAPKPIITCKRNEFNMFAGTNDTRLPEETKFGSIPLASNGWNNRKAKGDFFTLHPTQEEESAFSRLRSVADLSAMQISEQLIANLKSELDVQKLTSIQAEGIPKIMDSNHILIAAETGCGKTLAYLTPVVQQIIQRKQTESQQGSNSAETKKRKMNTPLALILTPGRELASQISDVARKLCHGTDIKIKTILGGNTKQKMLNPAFEEMDILVGTIGAISKLVTTGIYRMDHVRHVVLDEADTLLDDSFSDKLCYFLKNFPFHQNHVQHMSQNIKGSQLILASATMPTNTEELLRRIIDTETIHEVVSPHLHRLMPHVQQKFLRINKSDRPSSLITLVKSEIQKNRPLIIFGNKSTTSDFISIFLNNSGVNCINLNGDMLMKIRIGRFEKFQNGEVDVLATTDIGSRGLDTSRARHVINFDFPLHMADYIHRCGRVGRVGNRHKCLVTNFVSSQREIDLVQRIEHTARTNGILPNVNANITNLIRKNIAKDLKEEGVEDVVF